ncbi:tetratricopeptide repeat protein [Desulforhopalus vacuolatus]|uniref:tetratricopeptide repeat protein n=1 Tax=Desulforhopalus vacuolatus TaxID=40414 RepID=UPI001962E531|nr:tetratricopeptide repeat protein [Desulforhopalus vacuolatus]MBM9520929.1 tetratricopeptide repeat protein [Desulforhopalus vacuolatus]
MKPSIRNGICLVFTASLLTGCASMNEVDGLKRQIRMLNRKVVEMKSNTVDHIEKRQASTSGYMGKLQEDIDQLRSQIEDSYSLNQQLREQYKELADLISTVAEQGSARREEARIAFQQQQASREGKIQELDELLRKQERDVKAIQQARIREAERKAKEAALEARMAATKKEEARRRALSSFSGLSTDNSDVSSSTPSREILATHKKVIHSVPAVPAVISSNDKNSSVSSTSAIKIKTTVKETPKVPIAAVKEPLQKTLPPVKPVFTGAPVVTSALSEGKQQLADQNYDGAMAIFEKVARDSSSQDSMEAHFLMGQTLFNQKNYDLAVVHFQAVVSKSPGSKMAPQALLKQAQSFEKLADRDTAKLLYVKLVTHYKTAPEADIARTRLKSL